MTPHFLIRIVLAWLLWTFPAWGQTPADAGRAAPVQPLTVASSVERQLTRVENEVVGAAEAMPEEAFNFSPESLHIPGSDYKGVRNFGLQVKHLAASNFYLWSLVTGDTLPKDYKGGNGPESLRTKAEILTFLKDSFALGHRAVASLTPDTLLKPALNSSSSRLDVTTFAIEHAYDHYGQMVVYLRMKGIVPPASREK